MSATALVTTRYLLDTNICVYIINRRPPHVFDHFVGLQIGEIAISSITGAELAFGVAKSGSTRNQEAMNKFLAPLDMLIAAHALALGCTLVTNNTREFERVPGLRLENWVQV
jgi:tRNA(fMet)-specific endonuclease VapC